MDKNIKQYFNRGAFKLTGFPIIVLSVLIVVFGTWCLLKSSIFSTMPPGAESEIDSYEQISKETDKSTDKVEELADGLRKITEEHCVDLLISESKHTDKYSGFSWLRRDKEVELIKGYQWHAFGTVGDISKSVIDNCVEAIATYLGENFVSNTENTDNERVFGFEKGDVKCVFRIQPSDFKYFQLSCGDITENTTPIIYKEIYDFLNPEADLFKRVTIMEIEKNFVTANIGTEYGYFLLKKVAGDWIEITDLGEAAIDCEIVFDYGVPPSLVNNTCLYYKTTRDVLRYNEDLEEWEIWYNINNPYDKN